jgi:hypothetical protein
MLPAQFLNGRDAFRDRGMFKSHGFGENQYPGHAVSFIGTTQDHKAAEEYCKPERIFHTVSLYVIFNLESWKQDLKICIVNGNKQIK